MMNNFKKYLPVAGIAFLILLLVSMRYFSSDNFKPDAEQNSALALDGEFIVSETEYNENSDSFSEILIGDRSMSTAFEQSVHLHIKATDIISDETMEALKNIDGPKLLISYEVSVSVRCWILLSQKGIKDIFVFSKDDDTEVFKYKFRPERAES